RPQRQAQVVSTARSDRASFHEVAGVEQQTEQLTITKNTREDRTMANKNQTATERKAKKSTSQSNELKRARDCWKCGGAITTLGQLQPVMYIRDSRKARMRYEHKECPKAA